MHTREIVAIVMVLGLVAALIFASLARARKIEKLTHREYQTKEKNI